MRAAARQAPADLTLIDKTKIFTFDSRIGRECEIAPAPLLEGENPGWCRNGGQYEADLQCGILERPGRGSVDKLDRGVCET